MDIERRELVKAASRRARRAKRTSGRIFASAIGFGLAYYLDTQNGASRRLQLRNQLRRAARRIDALFAPDPAVDDIPPVFYPLLRSQPQGPVIRSQPQARTG